MLSVNDISVRDLETKGFLLISNFLTQREIAAFQWDSIHGTDSGHSNPVGNNISPVLVKIIFPKLKNILDLIQKYTNLKLDFCIGGFYADTKTVNFPWHQDHAVSYFFQQGINYVNFYMMIKKENNDITNITILPFDNLRKYVPKQANKIIGHAAQRFLVKDNKTEVLDDNLSNNYLLPINIENIAYTPKLKEGDLLLIRGDMPHRTQDNLSHRTAVSLRFAENNTVYKNKILETCDFKSKYIENSKHVYTPLFKAFEFYQRDSITIQEYFDYSQDFNIIVK